MLPIIMQNSKSFIIIPKYQHMLLCIHPALTLSPLNLNFSFLQMIQDVFKIHFSAHAHLHMQIDTNTYVLQFL
jgi:hypothetical protein